MADTKTPSTESRQQDSRQGTTSPRPTTLQTAASASAPVNDSVASDATAPAAATATQFDDEAEDPLPELGADHSDADSAFGGSGGSSGGTSIASSILAGQWRGGRRYQVTRENAFNIPSDDKQFESMHAGHLAHTLVDSLRANPYFRAPISKDAQHIIDIGTGSGGWANDVADMFPSVTVHGVDLYPPPTEWVAPNCIFEVDDATKRWTWGFKFDLVHIRLLLCALPRTEWKKLYKQAYDNLQPGGWIEHIEGNMEVESMPANPLPADSKLRTWKPTMMAATTNSGNAADVIDWMREEIEAAGFIHIHEHVYKLPTGDWPQHPIWKEAGRLSMGQFRGGFDGWATWGLATHGAPSPWSAAEIAVWCTQLRQELDKGYHIYHTHRRVWAQKPFESPPAKGSEPVLENVEAPTAVPAEAPAKY